jgi:hypothetical protein
MYCILNVLSGLGRFIMARLPQANRQQLTSVPSEFDDVEHASYRVASSKAMMDRLSEMMIVPSKSEDCAILHVLHSASAIPTAV